MSAATTEVPGRAAPSVECPLDVESGDFLKGESVTMHLDEVPATVGMSVVGSDGARIGWIADLREEAVLVCRDTGRDVLVPLDAIDRCVGQVCRLYVPSHDVEEMADRDWPTPGGA